MRTSRTLLTVLFLVGCGGGSKPATTAPVEDPAPASDPVAATAPAAVETMPAEPAAPPPPPPVEPTLTVKDVGLATPESVLYDEANDVYLVSNINGGPSAKDGNGFISKIAPDGTVVALKWIDGSAKATPLHAPKGMAIANGLLYVADIDSVRVFDRKTGKAKGTIALKGATFANDVAAGPDGRVYVSDSGVTIDDKGVTPTKTDAVWVIKKMKASVLAKSEELGKPNGLFATDKAVWVFTFGTGEIYTLDDKGVRGSIQKVAGALDGLRVVGDDIWVSSWETSGLMQGAATGGFSLAQGGLPAPADFGYDTKRKLVLVPLFNDNKIVAYSL
jgi:sugar lactone lactonase YvrE